jgi:replicative DNA helicase
MSNHSNLPMLHSEGAEKSVLSVIFQNPDTHIKEALAEGLTEDHFFKPNTKTLFNHICEIYREGLKLDLLTLSAELIKLGKLDELGGPSFLSEVYTYAAHSGNWTQHIDILRDRLARRKAHSLSQVLDEVTLAEKSPEELANLAKDAAQAILEVNKPTDTTKTGKIACDEFLSEFEDLVTNKGIPGIATSLDPIDRITGGMRAGELWVFCGPTSGGKSVLALQAAGSALNLGKKVGVFSLEMGAGECIGRMISCGYNVDYGQLRDPKGVTKHEFQAIKRALSQLSVAPVLINDEAGLTIERIESIAQKWKDAEGLDLLIVDYIQLVRTTKEGEARHEELSMIAGALKQLAKQLKVPVITASQLNAEGRMAKAKSIGDDSDVVLRIEEEGIYVLKNRNGEKHITLPLQLNGKNQKFIESYSNKL